MLRKVIKLSAIAILSLSSSGFAETIERYEPDTLPNNLYNEFFLSESKYLTNSKLVNYSVYKHDNDSKPENTIKLINFDPRVIDLVIQFSTNRPKHFTAILEQPGFVAAVNGITVSNFKPQGDIKGQDLDYSGNDVAIYQIKGDQSVANLRHSIGIKRNGMVEIMRGGIKLSDGQPRPNSSHNPQDFKYFINGAALLFNNETFKNEQDFLRSFDINNDKDLTKNMIPDSKAPRTALGVTENDKVIIGSFGEGRRGDGHGVTAYDIYKIFKTLNVKKAVMFDGGSATAMVTKQHNGYVTLPSSDYTANASFISVFDI